MSEAAGMGPEAGVMEVSLPLDPGQASGRIVLWRFREGCGPADLRTPRFSNYKILNLSHLS